MIGSILQSNTSPIFLGEYRQKESKNLNPNIYSLYVLEYTINVI